MKDKEKEKNKCWMIHHFQNISHQRTCTFLYSFVNDELTSTSPQILEQILFKE